jgi:hypothetical protein
MTSRSDTLAYILAVLLGLVAGYANLEVNDPTLSAVLVTVIAMGLALWKPQRPWRWALLVGFEVPVAQLFAYAKGVPPQHGDIARACFIGLISATVAAGLGSVGRRAFAHIFASVKPPDPRA